MRDTISSMDSLRRKTDQIDEPLALNTVKITDLESQRGRRPQQAIHSYNGPLPYKTETYQKKRQDAN